MSERELAERIRKATAKFKAEVAEEAAGLPRGAGKDILLSCGAIVEDALNKVAEELEGD